MRVLDRSSTSPFTYPISTWHFLRLNYPVRIIFPCNGCSMKSYVYCKGFFCATYRMGGVLVHGKAKMETLRTISKLRFCCRSSRMFEKNVLERSTYFNTYLSISSFAYVRFWDFIIFLMKSKDQFSVVYNFNSQLNWIFSQF